MADVLDIWLQLWVWISFFCTMLLFISSLQECGFTVYTLCLFFFVHMHSSVHMHVCTGLLKHSCQGNRLIFTCSSRAMTHIGYLSPSLSLAHLSHSAVTSLDMDNSRLIPHFFTARAMGMNEGKILMRVEEGGNIGRDVNKFVCCIKCVLKMLFLSGE